MRVLKLYQNDSDQLVNVNKSGYLVHPWVSVARQGVIKQVTKFSRKDFLVRYLGSPLFIGRCKGAIMLIYIRISLIKYFLGSLGYCHLSCPIFCDENHIYKRCDFYLKISEKDLKWDF